LTKKIRGIQWLTYLIFPPQTCHQALSGTSSGTPKVALKSVPPVWGQP
jgi:hypothetical protein